MDEPLDFQVDESQNTNEKRPEVENDGAFQLTTSDRKMIVPLKQVCFNVQVTQGFADIVIQQRYENDLETPLEVIFMMPISS